MKHLVSTEHKWESIGWKCRVSTEPKSALYFLNEDKVNPVMRVEGIIPQPLYTVVENGLHGPEVLHQGYDPDFAKRYQQQVNDGKENELEELQYSHGNNPTVIRATMDTWREAKREAILFKGLATLPDHGFTLAWQDEGPLVATPAKNESEDCLLFLSSERGPSQNYPRHDVVLSPEGTDARILRHLIFPASMAIVAVLQKGQSVALRIKGEYKGTEYNPYRYPLSSFVKKEFSYDYVDTRTWDGIQLVKTSTKDF